MAIFHSYVSHYQRVIHPLGLLVGCHATNLLVRAPGLRCGRGGRLLAARGWKVAISGCFWSQKYIHRNPNVHAHIICTIYVYIYTHTHTHIYIYIYTHKYIRVACIYVCLSVWMSECLYIYLSVYVSVCLFIHLMHLHIDHSNIYWLMMSILSLTYSIHSCISVDFWYG